VDQFEKAGQQAGQIFGRFVKAATEMGGELKREYEKEISRPSDNQASPDDQDSENTAGQGQTLMQSRLERLSELFSSDPELADLSDQQFEILAQYMRGSYLQAKALLKK